MKRFKQSCKAYNFLPKFDEKETANQQEPTKEIVNLIRAARRVLLLKEKSLRPSLFQQFSYS